MAEQLLGAAQSGTFKQVYKELGLKARHFGGVCADVASSMQEAKGEDGATATDIVVAALQTVAKECVGAPVPGLYAAVRLVSLVVESAQKDQQNKANIKEVSERLLSVKGVLLSIKANVEGRSGPQALDRDEDALVSPLLCLAVFGGGFALQLVVGHLLTSPLHHPPLTSPSPGCG